jgi:5-(carboxyamino)imidazole ribonucleotide synthase
MAPRPHNSGHYSIEACRTSQFENHARAALGLPLGSPELVAPAAVMINLLGKREGAGTPDDYAVALSDPKAALHVYGKDASRIGRKMGHVTLLGETVNGALRKARAIEKQIRL